MISMWSAPSDIDWLESLDPQEPMVKCPMTEEEMIECKLEGFRDDRCPCGFLWERCLWNILR